MRAFIAVDVPVNNEIKSVIENLRNIDTSLKLVAEGSLHITLAFLGEISESQKDEILQLLNEINHNTLFQAEMKGLEAISPQFLRVISVAINSEELEKTRTELVEKLNNLKIKADSHPAHLTLARTRTQLKKKELLQYINDNRNKSFGTFQISKLSLKKSTLTPKGAIYKDLN
ncbi:MAG: RNA 2',3'-cyclic phosphodiesterase [Candidatus Nanoarchaeia archaeon]|nr:RNA 2',3'-cyclic phosphodiesterase [Candidatus Nanoarchaeia archaeon]